ncbi:DUF397 domain-containing protein [Streptomyces sp. B6B3]|uniref:DUF397 domain-containing protein n=1 Tax=Streptomyces sp. B6B3 TaxID=3153570 RepID=UPI00325E3FE3
MSDVTWQKSSYSSGDATGNCLELARTGEGLIRLRESEDPNRVIITTPPRLASLLHHLR